MKKYAFIGLGVYMLEVNHTEYNYSVWTKVFGFGPKQIIGYAVAHQ